MKTNPFNTITAGLAALLVTPAFAIEAPADNAPPPGAEAQPAEQLPTGREEARPAVEDPSAFLGVHATEVPEMLAQHLGLENEGGVLIRALEPNGPAHQAGLEVNDIITRVGGHKVASPQDLTREIKAHKPDDKIALDVIHKGKTSNLDVTLGKRPDELADLGLRPLDQLKLDGIPKEMADRVRNMIQGNVGAFDLDFNGGRLDPLPGMDETMRDMKKRMEKALEEMKAPQMNGDANAEARVEAQQSATIRMMDNEGSVEYKSSNGNKEVTVRDKDNKVTWTGPWDTEQDMAAAPEDVRRRVDRLNIDTDFQGNGLRLRMNSQPAPVPRNE